VDDETDSPPPHPRKGKPAKAKAKRAAKDEISAQNEDGSSPDQTPVDHHHPANEVNDSSNQSSKHENVGISEGVSAKPWEPLERFTFWLAAATVVLAVATVGVAVATYGLNRATWALVHYAQEQAGDMKMSIQAATNAAIAAKDQAEATKKSVDIAQQSLSVFIGADDRAKTQFRANVFAQSAEISNLNTWFANPIAANVVVKNNGAVQADNVKIDRRLIVLSPNSDPCRVQTTDIARVSIPPNGENVFVARAGRPITQDEKQRVLAGAAAIFIHGKITWTDTQGSHYRNFRMHYRGDGSEPRDGVVKFVHSAGCNDGN